jgi:hypothetical protein
MIYQAIHYIEVGAPRALCGRGLLTVARTDEPSEVTCKQCLHKLNAPVFVGQNRNRDQYQLKCVGGPWADQDVVFPFQGSLATPAKYDGGSLSLPIRVGEHVGRYNLNTGHWVPMEQRA